MYTLLLTCEHGGNEIPKKYQHLFMGHEIILASHRGYDIGALPFAHSIKQVLDAPLYYSTTSRLLIDLNRSLTNKKVFSEFTRQLPLHEKENIASHYYLPYRAKVEKAIAAMVLRSQQVLHLSIHSFTPELNGKVRRADVGILFDPARERETQFATAWLRQLKKASPQFSYWKNYPYRGTSDGFTTYLRTRFPQDLYLGIELEVNQKFPLQSPHEWLTLQKTLISYLRQITEL